MICGTVYFHFYTDIPQSRLNTFRKKRQFLAAGISQPADRQILSVFIYIAVSVCVCPSCFLKKLPGLLRIICRSSHGIIPKGKTGGEGTCRRCTVAVKKHTGKAILIDSHGNGFPDFFVLKGLCLIIHLGKERPGSLHR